MKDYPVFLILILLYLNPIISNARQVVQLDTIECIRKKGQVKQLYESERNVNQDEPAIDPDFILFLIGDTGNPQCVPELNDSFYRKVHESTVKSSIVYLGDNVYTNGIPYRSYTSDTYEGKNMKVKIAETKLLVQLNRLSEYTGNAFFVPGNHDYHKIVKSPKRIDAQRNLITAFDKKKETDGEIAFKPAAREDLKVELAELTPEIAIIFIDSEWAVRKINKPESKRLFTDPLKKAFDTAQKYNYVILAAHHPLYSVGDHGHEKLIFASEDIHRKKYRKYIRSIESYLNKGINIIYAAGHDHSIQHIHSQNFHQIISGSGSKSNHIIKNEVPSDSLQYAIANHLTDEAFMKKRPRFKTALESLLFATNYNGYVQLEFYSGRNEVWMKVYAISDNSLKNLYSARLF